MSVPTFKILERLADSATGSVFVNWSVCAKQGSEGTASANNFRALTKLDPL